MSRRDWELCSGQCPPERPCPPPADSEAYRRKWDGLLPPTGSPPPCVHQGARLPLKAITPGCAGCASAEADAYACALHTRCTLDAPIKGVAHCPSCLNYSPAASLTPPAASRYEWISTARLARDATLLAAKVPADCSGIVGVPRSGILPAAAVATLLHLPLFSLARAGKLVPLEAGSRGRSLAQHSGPLVVVDDTVYSGHALRRARLSLRGKQALFAAVYARPEAAGAADFYARLLPCPHLLEWNLFNNGPAFGRAAPDASRHFKGGIACDLDGILLHDADSGGPPGSPYLTVRLSALPLIVTGRPSSGRAQTEAELRRWGFKWSRLEMRPDATPDTAPAIAAFKARHYAPSPCGFFVESDPAQAALIFARSGKPVICPAAGKVWQPGYDEAPPFR